MKKINLKRDAYIGGVLYVAARNPHEFVDDVVLPKDAEELEEPKPDKKSAAEKK